MQFGTIPTLARDLSIHRRKARLAEAKLQRAVQAYLDKHRGSAMELSQQIGVSVQYVCDIRYGRRKVSDAVVEALGRVA